MQLSKDQSLLMSEARLWLKLFSLSPISVCRLGAGKLNPCKESAGRAENPISSSFGRRSSSPAAPLPCDSGRRTHGPLLASETGQAAPAVRNALGRERSLKLWAAQLPRTKPWETAFLRHPEETARGHGSLHAESSH